MKWKHLYGISENANKMIIPSLNRFLGYVVVMVVGKEKFVGHGGGLDVVFVGY